LRCSTPPPPHACSAWTRPKKAAEFTAERQIDRKANPVVELESEEFREEMAAAIGKLPEREALVMSLYYDEELNLKEIGAVLGVSESRVCQIHGQALARLRSRLKDWSETRGERG
jgi:RNA polymerase sigma factor for flagellar operon FliA